jgi:hypothetical protein
MAPVILHDAARAAQSPRQPSPPDMTASTHHAAIAGGWRRDAVLAAAVALLSLALYVATLQPDLGGPEDTPKFQFLGHVLGTAHPPGYPLYVILSHLFVKVPVGTIAYRANLFSAVLAAFACAVAVVIGRQIGAGRWPAACAALALATGLSYWRSAVFAEVYSLAAVLAALVVSLLLAWRASGRRRHLLAAVAAFAAGLGNHLTIIGLAPAAALYVLAQNRRALTPRVLAAAAALLTLGVAQYAFIIVRTAQNAPYLESRAGSIGRLIAVVTADRFESQRFAFGPVALLTQQLPLVGATIGRELGVLGATLAAIGLVAALRRRNRDVALLAGSAAGMVAMIINLSGDVHGFITPVVVLLWPIAGLGLEMLGRVAGRRAGGRVLAAAVVAAPPLVNLIANYERADQSRQTGDGRFLRAVYANLPRRAAIVPGDYWIDMSLHYLALSGEGGPDRDIVRIPYDARRVREAAVDRRRVFAFAGAATFLGAEGLHFERASVPGTSLGAWLRDLPAGSLVAAAMARVPIPADLLTLTAAGARGRAKSFAVLAGAMGSRTGSRHEADTPVELDVDPARVGARSAIGSGALQVMADQHGARVVRDGHVVAHVGSGVALAAFRRDGRLLRALDLEAGAAIEVPFEGALYELTRESPCAHLPAGTWADASPVLASGSWLAALDVPGTAVVSVDPPLTRLRVTELLGAGRATVVGHRGAPETASAIELTRTGQARSAFRVALDAPGSRSRLRVDGTVAGLKICAHEPPALFDGDRRVAVVRPDFESEAFFGAGWSDAEATAGGRVRRAVDGATLLLPLAAPHAYDVALEVALDPATALIVRFNGRAIGTCEPRAGVPCEVTIPPGLAGAQAVDALTVSHPGSRLRFFGARIGRR